MIKTLKYDFDEPIELLVLSDLHIGDECLDIKMLKNTLKYIENNDNVYCFLNGDLLNMGLKSSVSFQYETMSPQSEYCQLVEMLRPIKDKILGLTIGNHDDRLLKESGIDVMTLLCRELDILDRYCKYQALLLIRIRERKERVDTHKIFVTHGIGAGGRMIGSKANFLSRLAGIISNANCYVTGHTHTPLHFTDKSYYIDSRHRNIKENVRHFINQPAFLSYGGYGQRQNFTPCSSFQYLICCSEDKLTIKELEI